MRIGRTLIAIGICWLAGMAGTAGVIAYGLGHDWDEFIHDVRAGDGDPLGWGLIAAMVFLAAGAERVLGVEWRLRWGAVACTSLAFFAAGLVAFAMLIPRGIHHFPLVAMEVCAATLGAAGLALLAAGARRPVPSAG